uniref:Uncharacterized serine-rich protein C1E8.05-like n=1 Tax=Tanacetum cinerariifolium TaxID=118510 RepID=A0A6L2P4U8_TANCI|nr:uncharacterized serine-rich protein C1E8.05-like [Tanacetum cinerariifolium]
MGQNSLSHDWENIVLSCLLECWLSRERDSLEKLERNGLYGVQKKVATSNEKCKIASKQLQGVERKINEFKLVLKKRLADPKTPKPIKTCLQQCQDNFEDAIDGVKKSIESIDKHNIPKANIDVSAVATDIDTCNECFLDMTKEDKEIKAFDEWVRGVTGDCLVNLQKT